MTMKSTYLVLAFYHIYPIQHPHEEVANHKEFFRTRDIASRIYISEEGINGQMSATPEAAGEYMDWMHSRSECRDIHFKIDQWHEHAFPRQTVKYRKHLVAHDRKIDLSQRGEHISPAKWRELLESDENYFLIDVRNDYEWELGRFEGAELPKCKNFRQFETYAETLKKERDPKKTPVMMYCTGGIRCEFFSSILKEKGFEKVYQLQGGVINYGQSEDSKHWLGKLFVFDDRLSVPISDEETPVIGSCRRCGVPSEEYYNCANMDCNHLFLSCADCLQALSGCCNEECQNAEKVRPCAHQNPRKPFRRKHLL